MSLLSSPLSFFFSLLFLSGQLFRKVTSSISIYRRTIKTDFQLLKIHLFHLYRNQSRFASYRSSTYFLYETIQNESGRERQDGKTQSGLEELTRIAGVTFVSVYLAISGCAIIKTSAALTYRLRAVVGKGCPARKRRYGSQIETRRKKISLLFDRIFFSPSSGQSAWFWPRCQADAK